MDGEKVLKDYLGEKADEITEHSERVATLCTQFAKAFPDGTVNRELLKNAAWLHDIAKPKYKEDHAEEGCVRDVLRDCGVDSPDLVAIIAAHKGNFEPEHHKLESAILRLCDKIDKQNKNKKDGKDPREKAKKAVIKSLKAIGEGEVLPDDQFSTLKKLCEKELGAPLKW